MNNKIYIVDRNGNQVIVEGIAYIELKGDGFANEYLFYTLNEIVNGDLNKIYVAKVNNDNLTIDDAEWENIKTAMRGITHQETIEGLRYLNMFDNKGEGKVFKTEIPRKLALKLDNLIGIKDTYKIAISNPDNDSDTSAVGGGQFIDPELLVDKGNEKAIDNTNTPSAFDGTIKPSVPEAIPQAVQNVQEVTSVAPVEQPVINTQPEPTIAPTPVEAPISPTPVEVKTPEIAPVEAQAPVAPVIVSQSPVVEIPAVPAQNSETPSVQDPLDEMKTIAPTPIPEVISNNSGEDGFAIPVNTPIQPVNDDNDIFNEIIKELSEIKNQNKEIQDSIRKLQNNIANISTNLSQQEITNSQGNYDGMINTNMANTTEDVSAIDITSNGSVVIPSFEQAQQTAQQTANVISTNVLDPSNNVIENTIINTAPSTQPVGEPATTILTQPVDAQPTVIEQPIEAVPTPVVSEAPQQPVVATPVSEPVTPVQAPPVVEPQAPVAPVQQEPTPAVIEQPTIVTEVPELPQIIPDVPVAPSTPNIIMPNSNPVADLPPVQMPVGVSAGEDSSAVGSTITGLPQ